MGGRGGEIEPVQACCNIELSTEIARPSINCMKARNGSSYRAPSQQTAVVHQQQHLYIGAPEAVHTQRRHRQA
eukprot:71233-Pelagomonas_calceolata.AAC.5